MLSRTVALPVIVLATVLKGARLRRRKVDPAMKRAMAAGVLASFASTLASQRLIRIVERDRSLWPYAAYRAALAALVLATLWRRSRRDEAPTERAAAPLPPVPAPASGDGIPPGPAIPAPEAERRETG
jgi:hypothetical protein